MRVLISFVISVLFTSVLFAQEPNLMGRSRIILSGSTSEFHPVTTKTLTSSPDSLSTFATAASSRTDNVVQNFDIDFGTVDLNSINIWVIDFHSSSRTIDQPMGDIYIVGDSEFNITRNECVGKNLAGGKHCDIEVRYLSSTEGSHSATVTVHWRNQIYDEEGELYQTIGVSNFHFYASTEKLEIDEIDDENSCELAANSSINVDKLSLNEYVDIVGVGSQIHYSSDRMRLNSQYNPKYLGLGGWTLSDLHYYDPAQAALFEGNGKRRKVLAQIVNDEFLISSRDSSMIYEFDPQGNHLRTRDAKTNVVLYSFDYDSRGRIVSLRDQFGKTTLINHLTGFSEIISPYGQVTKLKFDFHGHLASITNPNNETHSMKNDPTGLLQAFKKPMGQESLVSYDENGLVNLDQGAGGDLIRLIRSYDEDLKSQIVDKSTARGIHTYYQTSAGNDSSDHTVYGSNGEAFSFAYFGKEKYLYDNSYGEFKRTDSAPDPRFEWMSPYIEEYQFRVNNSPISIHQFSSNEAIGVDSLDPRIFSRLESRLQKQNDPSRSFLTTFKAASKTEVTQSPENRTIEKSYNQHGQLSSIQVGNLHPFEFDYDNLGRITKIKQGQRVTKARYDDYGNLRSLENPVKEISRFKYDKANRIIQKNGPGQPPTKFEYDKNGNLTSIRPPGKKAHRFDFDQMDLVSQYLPPELRHGVDIETRYVYNLDRQISEISLADGSSIHYQYNIASGLLESVNTPHGNYTYHYPSYSKLLESISTPDGVNLNYTYQGTFLESISTSGPLSNSVQFDYNPDASVRKVSIDDGDQILAVNYLFDLDDLLSKSGDLEITRGSLGEIQETRIGNISSKHFYSSYGELQRDEYKFKNKKIYSKDINRDLLGRIESVSDGSKNHSIKYHYDKVGRLSEVKENGKKLRSYSYDSNGNRKIKWLKNNKETSHYDTQDRLIRSGKKQYEYNLRGDLEKIKDGKKITQFNYDVFGNLRSVLLPDGKVVEYIVDGQNRRIGRKIDGQFKQGFVYKTQTQVIAELDENKKISKHFIYGSKPNIPDYMVFQNKKYRIISNPIGTPEMIVDVDSGAIVTQYGYDEFGILENKQGSIDIPFGFAGGLYDPDTQLTRFGARDYDGTTGRWLSKDPILFNGGDTNLYGYVLNDPVNEIDAEGTGPISAAICAGVTGVYVAKILKDISNINSQVESARANLDRLNNNLKNALNEECTDWDRVSRLEDAQRRWHQIYSKRLIELGNAQNSLGTASALAATCVALGLSPAP